MHERIMMSNTRVTTERCVDLVIICCSSKTRMNMDDWQETAFSNRHVHNRLGRRDKGGSGKANATFDVTKTFGTYEIRCPAVQKLPGGDDGSSPARMELFRLNEDGNAVLGELSLSPALHATVVLAASRKTMKAVVAMLDRQVAEVAEVVDEDGPDRDQGDKDGHVEAEGDDSAGDDSSDDEGVEEDSNSRYRTFEKNSFRSPKFWLQWQGQVSHGEAGSETLETDSGYLVFAKNDCSKLQGTISCGALGWNNVKLQGRKVATKSTRDTTVSWQKT